MGQPVDGAVLGLVGHIASTVSGSTAKQSQLRTHGDRVDADAEVEELARGGALFVDYGELALSAATETQGVEAFGIALEGEWAWFYGRATTGERDLRSFTVGTFTYLWDTTVTDAPEPEPRLVGLYGTSGRPTRRRDSSRMAGHPLRQPEAGPKVHRGHGAGHSLGGPDEGYNLFVQAASVNLGGRWRGLERYAAARPGTFVFVRCVYANASSTPSALEYGLLRQDGCLVVRRFRNV